MQPRFASSIRLPDDKHARIEQLARARKISVNKLLEDLATAALAGHDAELRFRALAAMGNPARALRILDRLDAKR
jgi:predicted DNA-binding ribbon-helix-helix protein